MADELFAKMRAAINHAPERLADTKPEGWRLPPLKPDELAAAAEGALAVLIGAPAPTRKIPVPFLPEHAALGFEKCTDFEWRAMTPAGAISWWPHARKWRLGLEIHQGDEAALRAFLARTLAVSDIAPPGGVFPSPAQVEAAQTRPSYWAPEVMAAWGVPNPPPKGWRKRLAAGYALQQREAANAR